MPAYQQPRFTAQLLGTTGNAITISMNDDERIIFHSPLIWYAPMTRQWVRAFMTYVAERDAQRMARLLTADDVEYPVDRASALIDRLRTRIDVSRGRFEFVGVDENETSFGTG